MTHKIIIINGTGGVGKDTLCEFAARHYRVKNVSSITPVKEIARRYGGWNGEKDAKSRKFLADLKQLFVDYNDMPFHYLCGECDAFLKSENEILFVHIREGGEIAKLKEYAGKTCVTLLVERDMGGTACWGNEADDNVRDYPYDFVYHNDRSLAEAEADFCSFLEQQIGMRR